MTAPQGFPAFGSNDHRALCKCLNLKGSRLLDVPERCGEASTALSGEALDRGCTGRSIILDLTPGVLLGPSSWLADGRRGALPISGRSYGRRRVESGQDTRAKIRTVPILGARTVHKCAMDQAGKGRTETPLSRRREQAGRRRDQERPSPDPCRLYCTLFNNLDAGVANPESCVTIKVASSTFQRSPAQSLGLQERACCLRCPHRRARSGLTPLLCRQDDHLRLDRRS
jgi:hypothetical protein